MLGKMSRNGAETVHSASAAGLFALKGNGLSDSTDRRVGGPGQVEKIDHGAGPLRRCPPVGACLNAGSDYGDDLNVLVAT
jgi:hypothetical protein